MDPALSGTMVSIALAATACGRWFPDEPTPICRDTPAWSVALTADPVALAADDSSIYLHLIGHPIVLGDTTFDVAGPDGQQALAALSLADGSLRWAFDEQFSDFAFAQGLALSPSGALFSAGGTDADLVLRRIDPADGAVMWRRPLEGERVHAIGADDQMVVLATWDDRIAAVGAESGEPLWTLQDPMVAHLVTGIAVVPGGDLALAQAFSGGPVTGADLRVLSRATGELLWSYGDRSAAIDVVVIGDGDLLLVHETSPATLGITRLAPGGAVVWQRRIADSGGVLDVEVDPAGDIVLLGGQSFDGVSLDDGCRAVARVSGQDGSTEEVDSVCFCGHDLTGITDGAGRVYLSSSDGLDGRLAAFAAD